MLSIPYYCGMNKAFETYWTAFYTKPRSEKKTAQRLKENGFEVYCPCQTVLKQWSDRKKKVTEPVFSSYLFAKVDEMARQEILKDQGIVCNVYWLRKPAVIRDGEMLAIQNFLSNHADVSVLAKHLAPGEEVAIDGGPLSGQSGVIQRLQGRKAHLTIQSLGITLQAEVGIQHLTKKKKMAL